MFLVLRSISVGLFMLLGISACVSGGNLDEEVLFKSQPEIPSWVSSPASWTEEGDEYVYVYSGEGKVLDVAMKEVQSAAVQQATNKLIDFVAQKYLVVAKVEAELTKGKHAVTLALEKQAHLNPKVGRLYYEKVERKSQQLEIIKIYCRLAVKVSEMRALTAISKSFLK